MTNTVTQFFMDWNEACVYAKECGLGGVPGLHWTWSFIEEPWTAIAVIAGLCYVIWRRNEKAIKNERAARRRESFQTY